MTRAFHRVLIFARFFLSHVFKYQEGYERLGVLDIYIVFNLNFSLLPKVRVMYVFVADTNYHHAHIVLLVIQN